MEKDYNYLVIDAKFATVGKCYKVNLDGSFDWKAFDPDDIIADCDKPSGNCYIVPKLGVKDPVIDKVKYVWETVTIILKLLTKNRNDIIDVSGYVWNMRSKNHNQKWICVKTEKSTYWLCFDRKYMEEVEDGVVVNSIYGMLQFYRDITISYVADGPNSRQVVGHDFRNRVWTLFYHDTFKDDSLDYSEWVKVNTEEMNYSQYGLTRRDGVIHKRKVYNPKLTIGDSPEQIALEFLNFIKINEK